MHRVLSLLAIAGVVLGLGACASAGPSDATQHETSEVLHLGDHYESPVGNLFVIRVQDEYKLIRCTSEGAIAGCYEDVLSLSRDQVSFNRWVKVQSVPGLEMAVVSATEVAFRHRDEPRPR